ncbi:PD-(D/E)XK nuclease family protein [bacterium]|nr:PD-(D/E)XK nuclease family protein [bacterium]
MAVLPERNSPTVEAIYNKHESGRYPYRPHLGASLIGRECERELWYTFRWCSMNFHSGRILRLFDTGQREEERFVEELRTIGIEVHDQDEETGKQYGFSDFGGHFGGSIDGVALGILEAPKTWHLLEFKTYNDKRFALLKQHGVKQTSPEHYAQMVVYMDYLGLKRAFYLAVNKNTDELYGELLKPDPEFANLLKQKAERILSADRPLTKISDDPEFWKCRFCSHRLVCHEDQPAEVNCRTCLHSEPVEGGWHCMKHNQLLTTEEQLRGCNDHLYIPDLLPGEVVDAGDDHVNYQFNDGTTVRNGRGGMNSKQILIRYGTTNISA